MQSDRTMTTNEMIKYRQDEYQRLVKEFATDLLFTIKGNPLQINFTLLMSAIDRYNIAPTKRDLKKDIIDEIQKSEQTAENKYAAIALLNLRDKMSLESDVLKHYEYIVESMLDENISLSCMNATFKHFAAHMYTYLHELPSENKVRKYLFPSDHPAAWLNMVEKLQEIAEKKLGAELGVLEGARARVSFLEEAKKLEIFTASNHNHAIDSLFSRKASVRTIDDMINRESFVCSK